VRTTASVKLRCGVVIQAQGLLRAVPGTPA
jgi:hypothetical protein